MSTFPFYFSWVAPGTPFNPAIHNVQDEEILSFKIEHSEGEIPSLTIEIRNPRIGLLAPGRLVWAWFSWDSQASDGIVALFFGRLVSVPTDLLGEAVTLRFSAQPLNFLVQKQSLAPSLQVRPYWDPVFIDIAHRLDPDSVLEGYSAFWHVDRVFNLVSISDVLVGEDGLISITSSEGFYDSVNLSVDKPPLRSVYVKATVKWTQQAVGTVDMLPQHIQSYSGDGLISGWPKPLASLGAGWTVAYSSAYDVYNVAKTQTITITTSWKNQEKSHNYGDPMSFNQSWTRPIFRCPYLRQVVTSYSKIAIIDQDPDGFNDPTATTSYTDVWVPLWTVSTTLVLRYEAMRQRTEDVRFTLAADLQPVFTDPGGQAANFAQDSELIDVQGSVGLEGPYGTDRGTWAPDTQYYLYDYFIVTVAGIQHAYYVLRDHVSEPAFNEQSTAGVWQPFTYYGQGENVYVGGEVFAVLVSHQSKAGFNAAALDGNGNLIYQFRPNPFSGQRLYSPIPNYRGAWLPSTVYVGNDIVIAPGGTYYKVIIGHTSGSTFDPYGTDPTGQLLFALLLNPAPIGDLSRRSYLPTDRGLWSLEYLIMRARAALVSRSRAVKVTFECPFHLAVYLSCRKNAQLFDSRLPGGQATGKVTSYKLIGVGVDSAPYASITISCAVGNGNAVHEFDGNPTYAAPGYAVIGYQYYTDRETLIGAGDVNYSYPADSPIDDGLVFPLDKTQSVISETITTNPISQEQAIITAYTGSQQQQLFLAQIEAGISEAQAQINLIQSQHISQAQLYEQALAANPSWYELVLNPVVNGPFSTEYDITVSELMVPQQINLAAPSSP